MNTQNFNQSGGFPLETETLDQMQTAYGLFNKLGDLAGNFSIISGCETNGALVNDGTVYINGEMLEFKGGQIATTVIIVEEVAAYEFEDGSDKDVLFIRYATFGISTNSFPWINFKRPKTTIELTEQKAEQTLIETLIIRIEALEERPLANVPEDLVALWMRPANEIPTGWIEYQPMRGRTAIGLDPNYDSNTNGDNTNYNLQTLGYPGGKREHQLTEDELPKIDEDFESNTNITFGGGNGSQRALSTSSGGGSNISVNVNFGDDQAHTNMSPYRVVHYIQYKG